MRNCKGWDIAYYPDHEITVEQHFCRVYGDCGATDDVTSGWGGLRKPYKGRD